MRDKLAVVVSAIAFIVLLNVCMLLVSEVAMCGSWNEFISRECRDFRGAIK